jgi:hypothetical protein
VYQDPSRNVDRASGKGPSFIRLEESLLSGKFESSQLSILKSNIVFLLPALPFPLLPPLPLLLLLLDPFPVGGRLRVGLCEGWQKGSNCGSSGSKFLTVS